MDRDDQNNKAPDIRPSVISEGEMDDEINLIDLIYPIYKRKKFLILFCLGVAIGVGIVSYFLPKTYEATAVILPLSNNSSSSISQGLASTLLNQVGLSGLSGLGGSGNASSRNFVATLKSNELAADVLKRYDYFSRKGVRKAGEINTSQSIAQLINITNSKDDDTISISVQSDDPVFASDLVNTYVKALDAYNLNNSFTTAGNLRKYLEKRMDEADRELNQAQLEMRQFQEKNKAISISTQAEQTLKVLGDMEAQKVALEVQKSSQEKFFKGAYIGVEQLTAQIDALQKNIDRLTYSQEASVPLELDKGKIGFYIPLNSIPGLNFDESKLLLKVNAKAGVITLLTSQLEQARLDEAKDMPTINILERSYPPNWPVKPRIALNVILGIVVSLFFGLFIVFFIEFIQRIDQDPDTAPKWNEMKEGLTGLLKFKRKYKW